MLFIVDICAETNTEKYTPLHFAARFYPHNIYEDVGYGTAAEQTDAPTDSGRVNRSLSHQKTCEETMSYIIEQSNVDVSQCIINFVHIINITSI